ncbi:hypothetical protein BBO99_00007485 [Phytophthora kernoviae]|uniref:Dynein light chain n=2 Tax=Phytophthora kernoviae TaxID=325452 RepID=A0A3R7HF68_9STRA|nr:hypothetical protein G195_008101 [Phytophthora kernoviae 00238/432]KAG2519637.1 hypothetical protein JM16_007054 [Phytophthora kernoviae]KAG2520843.1 hypothetical protein JM18_006913 [Phytophthora kernoviae]RLN02985.1 hypothetical protein BBI17_007417 [Phytophthora kernoviae]RLN76526.1 hypothetical protein BBO99_00007485 [Phytophthora kernoviae]
MLLALGRFAFLALTDVAMLPALDVMKRNRRHFELFVGVLQLVVSFCFNAVEAFGTQFFLKETEWHFISDVLSITYFLLLCVHLMGYRDENHNIVLRYVAFAGAWLFKTKDGWDSTLYEGLLVVSYLAGVAYRRLLSQDRNISPLNKEKAKYALSCLAAAAVVGGIPIFFEGEDGDNHTALGLAKGCMHVLGGAAFYFTWLSVPCLDSKKDDIIPTYSPYRLEDVSVVWHDPRNLHGVCNKRHTRYSTLRVRRTIDSFAHYQRTPIEKIGFIPAIASVAQIISMSKAQKKDDVSVGGLRIVYQDTSKELEELILTSATNALKALYKGEKTHFTEVAQQVKHEIEESQEGAWHVIVGKSFGSFVSHEVKK